ncbi:MAG: DUF2800 domain-containing protein [Nitrospiraceae bacterium]
MSPKKHARLSASGSHRWMHCTGSVRATAGMESKSSKYAIEGTAAHELAAACLTENRSANAQASIWNYATTVYDEKDVGHVIPVTQEMIDAVQMYVDYVRERAVGGELRVETEFDLAPLKPPEPMFGTADAMIWFPDKLFLEVADLKYGQGVTVEAEDNSQLMMYALGAVVALGKRPERIRVTIVQPRGHHDEGPIRSYEFTWAELVEFKNKLFGKAKETQDPNAPLTPGPWCKFCPALPTCSAHHKLAVATAQEEFSVLSDEGALPPPDQISPEQRRFVLENAQVVIDWLQSVQADALARVLRGEEVEGFKVVEGRSNRKWKDEERVEMYLTRKGLKVDERRTSKLISPAQAEKIFKAKGFKKIPEKFIEKPPGAPRLAPADDPRPAMIVGIDAEFEVLAPTHEE